MDWVAIRSKATEWIGKYKYLLLVVLVGVGLMLIPGRTDKEQENPVAQEIAATEDDLAQKLSEILSGVDGAGKVQVMLTEAVGEQIVYQTNGSINGSDSNRSDTVIITDGDRNQSGLVQKVNKPVYRGAIVLCQGAESAAVRLAIIEAVSKVTGLDSSKISVLKMK